MDAAVVNACDTWFVAIGASGGDGLDDIKELLHALDPDLNAVLMVVLHRPFDRVSNLRNVLQGATRMPVTIAGHGNKLEPGRCYIGEPAHHLSLLADHCGGLIDDPGNLHRNRTVDLLFGSVAKYGKHRTVGIVLSGSLDDGSRGLEAIHQAGGKTMVLLRDDRQGHGMPENAISFDGPIDCVGSVEQIADAIGQAICPSGPAS